MDSFEKPHVNLDGIVNRRIDSLTRYRVIQSNATIEVVLAFVENMLYEVKRLINCLPAVFDDILQLCLLKLKLLVSAPHEDIQFDLSDLGYRSHERVG